MRIKCANIVVLLSLFFCNHSICQNDIQAVLNKIKNDYFSLYDEPDSSSFIQYAQKIIKQTKDTFSVIGRLAAYFGDPHLTVIQAGIIRDFKPTIEIESKSKQDLERYFSINTIGNDRFAGYWVSDLKNCVIALIKDSLNNGIYDGYVVEAKDSVIVGKRIIRLHTENDEFKWVNFIDYDDGYAYRSIERMKELDLNEFQVGYYCRWKRVKNYSPGILNALLPLSRKAFLQIIDTSTILITIPTCSDENISIVDSLVDRFRHELSKSRLLIIDVRNNTGGDPRVYSRLLPFVYTNPIKKGKGFTLVTEDLILYEQRQLGRMDSVVNAEKYAQRKGYIDSLLRERGTRRPGAGKTYYSDSIYTYPQHVAIIANYGTVSAAEVMLLNMKQSKKVTIFGENTAGGADNLDYFPVLLPSKKYYMFVPSFRVIPTGQHLHYGSRGIAPDIYIPRQEKNQIQFVQKYFEKN